MAKTKKRAGIASATKSTKGDTLRVRVTGEQKRIIEDAAERDGLDLSSWVRRLALREAGALPEAK